MPIQVTVRPTATLVSSVEQKKSVVSSINFGPTPNISLGQLINVDASDPDDGEALVYDAAVNKYVVKQVTANNIPNIHGGIF